MIVRNALMVVPALALLVPRQELLAQLVSKIEAGTVVADHNGPLPDSYLAVTPAVRMDYPWLSLSARGSAWLVGQQWEFTNADARGSLLTPVRFGLRGELQAGASRAYADPTNANDQLDGQVRVHMPFRHGGIWIGGGLERPLRVAVSSNMEVSAGGAYTRLGNAMLTGSITNFSFTKLTAMSDSVGAGLGTPLPCTTEPLARGTGPYAVALSTAATQECHSRQSQFRDVQGGLEWASHTLEVQVQAGYRFGDSFDVAPDSRRWGSIVTTYWLNNQVAAVMGHIQEPASPSRGLPARSYTNFGLVFAYSTIPRRAVPVEHIALVNAFEVREAEHGERTLVIRAGGIETVEVMGDFTDWEPKPLTRYGRDHWETTIPLPKGIHEINVRLDGGKWRPPPGMPTRRDGFNGEVGILVVE